MAELQPVLKQWPSLETQLTDVIPGSALEQLIKQNQDFSMLAPGEVNDHFAFPPWLRVWWRKIHPELDFSGPNVGYPLFLKEILGWMSRHQDLQSTPVDSPSPAAKPDRKARGL
jgi:hypothetical protein